MMARDTSIQIALEKEKLANKDREQIRMVGAGNSNHNVFCNPDNNMNSDNL